jgi:diadenosine tetraphosphate (Ap4A) HIT family hydrolase
MNSNSKPDLVYCPICQEFGDGRISPRTISVTSEFIAIATMGCFTPGYSLLLPHKHVTAFSCLGLGALSRTAAEARRIKSEVERCTGRPVIIAEHGEAKIPNANPSCSCIAHAHWHIIPVNDPGRIFAYYCAAGGLPRILKSVEELANISEAYLYLDAGTGQHFVWTNTEAFARQFCRYAAAIHLGIPEYYNWRQYPFAANIKKTVAMLRPGLSVASEVA